MQAERISAEESGWADLARTEEQLARTMARIDGAKQRIYFPEVKGYR